MLKKIKSYSISYYFIIVLRFVVGTVFIPSGLLKLHGKRFSTICPDMYQGAFFLELNQTGIYWNFLGFCQLLTAFLLFTQRYTVLAATFFLGICTNIFVFTISVRMIDKIIVMFFMMISALLLMLWDSHRFNVLFCNGNNSLQHNSSKQPSLTMQIFGFILFIIVALFFLTYDTYYSS